MVTQDFKADRWVGFCFFVFLFFVYFRGAGFFVLDGVRIEMGWIGDEMR